jgi:signal transduction histidine kinase
VIDRPVIDRLWIRILAIAAVLDVTLVLVLRVWRIHREALAPEAIIPLLSATAALCVVGLSMDRLATAAWLATVAASSIATVDLASLARDERSSATTEAWIWWSVAVTLSGAFATAAAVAFASGRDRRVGPWIPAIGVIVVAGVMVAGVWAIATPGDAVASSARLTIGNLGLVTRIFLVGTATFLALGLTGGARPAAVRATWILAQSHRRPTSLRDRLELAPIALVAFMRELAPWRDRIDQAERSGRARIASDLHVTVIPGLRRALRDAERAPGDGALVTALRDVLQHVDDIVTSETVLHLADGSLVSSLETLAERTEDRSEVRVTLDLPDGDPGSGVRPPIRVAEAAIRVATLALDNVVRHAPAANVRMRVVEDRDVVTLSIEDDGPGLPERAKRLVPGRRGLLDMAAEAASAGASVVVTPGADGRGTIVAFRWPASRHVPD